MKKKYKYTFNHYFIERNFNKNLNENFSVNIFNASSNIKEDIPADISNFRYVRKKKKKFCKTRRKKKKEFKRIERVCEIKIGIFRKIFYISREKNYDAPCTSFVV